ncbi:S1 motif domain-containing protein [Abeliophyllum distichum]|uniref:S1 motif domain-containing protein n=1 Tax=Abeliophyllum distichum TaxID=126358 RepID=A0ABD1PRS3_9LAMI
MAKSVTTKAHVRITTKSRENDRWKFLAFESWLRRKGLDPSLYRQNLGIIGKYEATSMTISDESMLDSKSDYKTEGHISSDMKQEDLLMIYDQEKLKYLSSFVGQKIKVGVALAERKSRRLIFSIKSKEKEELVEKKRSLMAKLSVGDVVKCCIKKITYFGIFVEDEPVVTPFVPHNTNQHNEHFQNNHMDPSPGETTADSSSTDHNSIPLIHVPFPDSPENVSSDNLVPRHSTRHKSKPVWMEDYITNVTKSSNNSTTDQHPPHNQMKLSYEPEPTVWPSELDAQHVISRFRALPEMEQTQRMFNQESYTDQRIRKSQEQAQKLQRENKIKDIEILMHQCMAGLLNLQKVPPNYTTEMGRLADQRKQDILARMEELQRIGVVNPQMEGNQVMNFPLVNPGSKVGFGWGNVPYGFDNTDHPGPSFSIPPGNTNAGSSSNPPENDAPGPSFRN